MGDAGYMGDQYQARAELGTWYGYCSLLHSAHRPTAYLSLTTDYSYTNAQLSTILLMSSLLVTARHPIASVALICSFTLAAAMYTGKSKAAVDQQLSSICTDMLSFRGEMLVTFRDLEDTSKKGIKSIQTF